MPAGKLLVVQFPMNKPPGGTAPPANQPDPALGPAAFIYIVISIAYILSGLFCPARATDNSGNSNAAANTTGLPNVFFTIRTPDLQQRSCRVSA